jgi:hypothetical protein
MDCVVNTLINFITALSILQHKLLIKQRSSTNEQKKNKWNAFRYMLGKV